MPIRFALAAVQQGQRLAKERCFPSLADALEAVECDAVLITTILGGHVPVALEALAAGKHVLLEKPFAPTLADARRAVDAAAARGKMLMISQNYRFYPAARTVAALVREGTLGAVGAVSIDFRRYANSAPPEGHRHYALRQPLLLDMAIHHFDLMRMVLGQEPTPGQLPRLEPALEQVRRAGRGGGDDRIRRRDGRQLSRQLGQPRPQTPWAGEWRMECERGEIFWTSRDDQGGSSRDKVVVRSRTGKERTVTLPKVRPHGRAGALAHFAESVQAGIEPETSGRDNLGTIALVHAAVASAATGQAVAVG